MSFDAHNKNQMSFDAAAAAARNIVPGTCSRARPHNTGRTSLGAHNTGCRRPPARNTGRTCPGVRNTDCTPLAV